MSAKMDQTDKFVGLMMGPAASREVAQDLLSTADLLAAVGAAESFATRGAG
jgi:hypothetical protein